MKINGLIISDKKLAMLTEALPELILRNSYENDRLSDKEISKKYSISYGWVCKLRRIYGIKTDPNYLLRRNPLRFTELSKYQKEVLHGSLMGDSLIAVQKSGTGYWKCMHCIAQKNLLLKKAEILDPFIAKVFYGERPFKKGGKKFPYICGRSYALPQFTEYRSKFYPEDKKLITADIFSELTPIGFAFWWMDDGLKTEYGFNIVTYDAFFKIEAKLATEIFMKKLGLEVRITWYGDEGNICILKGSHEKAWEYIKHEITSDLKYKLPRKYRSL